MMRATPRLFFTCFALLLAVAGAATNSSAACNNSPSLCSRTYNNVTYLGAHDSPFVRDADNGYTTAGDQLYNTTMQLSAGVRLVTAQVQLLNSTGAASSSNLHVCHSSCALLDAGTLSDWLGEIKTWMDSNPNEVVTVLLVNGADATDSALAAEYDAAGLSSYAYTPSSSTATADWPTLQAMISDGKRLVNFVADLSDNSAAPYLMNEFNYIFENSYENSDPTAYSCELNRPSSLANQTSQALADNYMSLMNHFLYEDQAFGIQTPNETYANVTNAASSGVGTLGSAAAQCKAYYGKAPNFLLVDFFNVGSAIDTADTLNGVSNPVGRSAVSESVPAANAGARVGARTSAFGICGLALAVALLL